MTGYEQGVQPALPTHEQELLFEWARNSGVGGWRRKKQSEDRMEIYRDEHGSGASIQSGLSSGLQVVMSFIRRLINKFKVTPRDLRDAGVYLGRMYE